MNRLTATATATAIALCLLLPHGAQGASLPAELLGTWGLSEAAADLVAPNCRSLTYHFDATTVTEAHGEMVLKMRYDIVDEGPPWSLRQVVVAFNMRPNCIGTLMPYALGQRLPDLRIERQGERLRLHLLERRGGTRHVDLVRVSVGAGGALAAGGAVAATNAAAPAGPTGPARPGVTWSHRTDPGAAMTCAEVAYPEVAEREGAQGVTRIRFTVDANGMPVRPEITNTAGATRAHRVLDRAAVEALAKCVMPVDKTPPGTVMVVDYVWRLPAPARPPGL